MQVERQRIPEEMENTAFTGKSICSFLSYTLRMVLSNSLTLNFFKGLNVLPKHEL